METYACDRHSTIQFHYGLSGVVEAIISGKIILGGGGTPIIGNQGLGLDADLCIKNENS